MTTRTTTTAQPISATAAAARSAMRDLIWATRNYARKNTNHREAMIAGVLIVADLAPVERKCYDNLSTPTLRIIANGKRISAAAAYVAVEAAADAIDAAGSWDTLAPIDALADLAASKMEAAARLAVTTEAAASAAAISEAAASATKLAPALARLASQGQEAAADAEIAQNPVTARQAADLADRMRRTLDALLLIAGRLTADEINEAISLAPYVMPTGYFDVARMHVDRHQYTRGDATVAAFFGDSDEYQPTAARIDPLIALAMRCNDELIPARAAQARRQEGQQAASDLADLAAVQREADARKAAADLADAKVRAGSTADTVQIAGAAFVSAAVEAAAASHARGAWTGRHYWIAAQADARILTSRICHAGGETDRYYVHIGSVYADLSYKIAVLNLSAAWRAELASDPARLAEIAQAARNDAAQGL